MGVKCIAVFLALFSSVEVAMSCDAAGLSKCNQDYLSGLSGVSGTNQTCSHISTMMECLKSKCSGCAGNVMAPFTMVKDNACGSGKTCEGTSLCDMSLECGSNGSSGAASVTLSRLAIIIACLVFFNSMEVATSCDSAGLTKCNQDYLSGLSGVSGTNQTCSHISTMMECLKSKCSGCAGNVMAPFTMVKDNSCGSGKTCEGTSLCDMSLECGSSGSSGAASVTLSRFAMAGIVFAALFAIMH